MDLRLWRHGDAMSGKLNPNRPLTERGRQRARRVATWLRAHPPEELRVLGSPAARAHHRRRLGTAFRILRLVGPDAVIADVIATSNWPDKGGAVLVVGHQPALGRLAALLLSGREADWAFMRGSLWWFRNRVRRNETQTVLRTVVAADLITDHYLSLEQIEHFPVAVPAATRAGEQYGHATF